MDDPNQIYRVIDFINLIALFLAVWHTVRRLDTARHEAFQYPDVQADEFARWKRKALGAHGTVLWTCFGYIALDLGFKIFGFPALYRFSPAMARVLGASLLVLWLVGIIVGMMRVRRAERLREDLGIELGRTTRE